MVRKETGVVFWCSTLEGVTVKKASHRELPAGKSTQSWLVTLMWLLSAKDPSKESLYPELRRGWPLANEHT